MLRRLVSPILLAVFLGAGTTLPGPDALLYHWSRQSEELRSHVEAAGGCGSHAEHCTLGRTATGASASIEHAPTVRVHPYGSVRNFPTSLLRIIAVDRDGIPQPRAPPAPVV